MFKPIFFELFQCALHEWNVREQVPQHGLKGYVAYPLRYPSELERKFDLEASCIRKYRHMAS